MDKDKKEVAHRFHFVVNEEMHNDLVELSTRYDMSISGLVKYIMDVCSKFLEEKHFAGIEQEFNSVVAWSKEIQVYFDDSNIGLFRSLKALHHNLDTYSMAQILRFTIQYFLDGVSEYGSIEDFVEEQEKKDKEWIEKVKKNQTIKMVKRPPILRRGENGEFVEVGGSQLCREIQEKGHFYIMKYDEIFRLIETTVKLEENFVYTNHKKLL